MLVPADVKVSIKSRIVTVEGPRGKLTKSFKHANVEFDKVKTPKGVKILVSIWFGASKQLSTARTIVSHLSNLFIGVTKGFRYRMKFVYAHFPINANIPTEGPDAKRVIEIRNYLGEKIVRRVPMLDGVYVERSTNKDEIILYGNDVQLVSQSAASIQQSTVAKNKDIRKFLDGVYVSSREIMGEDQ